MFCFSKTCRICKCSTNSFALTCNSQTEVRNLLFSMIPELMNSILNSFLKNLCVSCVEQLLSFENFKNYCVENDEWCVQYLNQLKERDGTHPGLECQLGIKQEDCQSVESQLQLFEKFRTNCIESDQYYMRYLNQLKGHDGVHAEIVCKLGIKQENYWDEDDHIQPVFKNNGNQEASSYYGSATHFSSTSENIQIESLYIKPEIIIPDIKDENEEVEEAISILGFEDSGSEEIRDTSMPTNIELFSNIYHRSIDKKNVKLENVELPSRITDCNLKINDTRMENENKKMEYCQKKCDLSGITEGAITEIDVVKQEVCIDHKKRSYNSFDSSVNNKETQEIVGNNNSLNNPTIKHTRMVDHMINNTDKKPHECDICKKSFKHKYYMTEHRRIHTGEKPYECDICKKIFTQKSQLLIHKRIHTGEKPYECDVCKKSFAHKYLVIIHKRTHTDEKLYECDICRKSFSQKSHVTRHKRTHTGEKPYECDICKKRYSLKEILIQHKRIHTGEKPFDCDICKRSFSRKGDLFQHKKTHTGEKPFECDVCKKSYVRKQDLIHHIRTHTGENSYKCDVCKKKFSRKNILINHKRTHTGEKSYECDICKQRCSRKEILILHKRTHTGEKPYECDVCNKSFANESNMKRHKRTHTGEKPYECDVGKNNFSCISNLKEHIKEHCLSKKESLIEERECDSDL